MTNTKIKTNTPPKKKAANIQVDKLRTFEGHPFKVLDDEDMGNLIESIRQQGIISPLIVRAIESTDEYEVISGHRRLHAAVKAGLSEVPALIYPLDRSEAMIAVVDSNLHRERLLPSEKAFAYKIKMDAMKAQGRRTDLTLSQAATKSDTASEIGKSQNESRDQVFRYIRLTYLIPELLDKVDEGIIALSPAVELSYLSEKQQKMLLDAMSLNDCTPSHAQSIRMKKQAQQNILSSDSIYEIMSEEKANQTERISFKVQDLKGFFPKNFTQKQMTDTILKLLYEYLLSLILVVTAVFACRSASITSSSFGIFSRTAFARDNSARRGFILAEISLACAFNSSLFLWRLRL